MVGEETEKLSSISYEINLARSVHRKFRVTPPIDVATVASHYAIVEYATIPFAIDGICLDLKKPGVRPTIVINNDRPSRRRRFTLAHELGHVLIPWHRGSLFDDFSAAEGIGEFDRWEMEGEANRFASELLMPADWIAETLRLADDFGVAISRVHDGGIVSMIASAIRVIAASPPQNVFAYCDAHDVVLNAGRSPGTWADAPAWGEKLDRGSLDEKATFHGTMSAGSAYLHWWTLPREVKLTEPIDSRSWREILDGILSDLGHLQFDKHKVRQSINGVIGAANSSLRGCSPQVLLAALTQRFGNKRHESDIFRELSMHPDFHDFLSRRVESLRREAVDAF